MDTFEAIMSQKAARRVLEQPPPEGVHQATPRSLAGKADVEQVVSTWAMASVFLMLMLAVLDSSALQIALPLMLHSIGVTAAGSIWILISFQVALVALLLPFSAIADCIGYRLVFMSGGLVFVAASLFCALSHGIIEICAARALQGIGAAAIYSTNPSLIRLIFPGERLRRGIALSSITNALSLAAGPSIGAALISMFDWRFIFLINLPVGVAALLIGLRSLPPAEIQELASARSLNALDLILSSVSVPLLIVGLDHLAFNPLFGLAIVFAGTMAMGMLIIRQRNRSHQIIPISLFCEKQFSISLICSIFAFLALSASYTALPFLFLHRTEATIRHVALYMMTPPLFTAAGNWAVAPLSRQLSELKLCSLGMLAMAGGALGLAIGPLTGLAPVASLSLLGLGFGLFQTPNNRMILSAAPQARSGNVSGTLAVARTIGQTGGSSVVSVCLALAGAPGAGFALGMAALLALASSVVGVARRGWPS